MRRRGRKLAAKNAVAQDDGRAEDDGHMRQRLRLERNGDLARIEHLGTAQSPEGFDAALIDDLMHALDAAIAMPDIQAVVLSSGSGGWPVAPDPADEPAEALLRLTQRIAQAQVPVISVNEGMVSGAGLALAQAAFWRVLRPGARVSAPEFNLGLIPSGGTAVRLARRAGPYVAADLLTSGRVLKASEALSARIVDAVSDVVDAPSLSATPPVTADQAIYLSELARFRIQIPPGPLAPVALRLVEVLEAALLLPADEAIAFEQVAREDLLQAELSAALRHVAQARRQAARLAGVAAAEPVQRVALWNQPDRLALGLMRAGAELRLGASDPGKLEASLRALAEAQDESVASGKLDPAARSAIWARVEPVISTDDLAPADLIVAAPLPSELPALRAKAGDGVVALEGVAPEGSELGLCRLPGLVEVHGPSGTSGLASLAATLALGRDLVIHARDLGAWFEIAYISAAERALMAGASPDAIDAALTGWGFAEGPFARLDRRGLDVIMDGMTPPWHAGPYLNWLAIEGRRGQSVGRGVRLHGDRVQAWPDEAEELAALRQEAGIVTRPMPAREIVSSILAELALAGVLALQSERAHRTGDIDLVAIAALGLARHRGGPMFQADRTGLLALRKRLRQLEADGAPPPAALLDVLIRNGLKFSDLDSE